jgi:tRNA 2-thiouridine synthesizing protein E
VEGAAQAAATRQELGEKVRRIAGKEITFDGEGFFWDYQQWNEEVAKVLAKEAGLVELSEIHWNVIRFLRMYYSENGRAPLNRQIKHGTGVSLLNMEALFPGGIKHGARRLAGLPNPKSCS